MVEEVMEEEMVEEVETEEVEVDLLLYFLSFFVAVFPFSAFYVVPCVQEH